MGFGGTKPGSSCSVASSALLETGSTPGRAACPWDALGFADGDRLLLPSSSGLLLGGGSARTERFPTRSPPAASARFTQLPTVSCSTAPESQGRRVSHPGGRAAHIWIAHIWMAELLSAAFAEAPTGEEHENPLATQRAKRRADPENGDQAGSRSLSQTDPEGSLLPAAVAKGRRWEKPRSVCNARLRNLPASQ